MGSIKPNQQIRKLVDTIYNLQIAFRITSILQMNKGRRVFKKLPKNQLLIQTVDQNKPKNQFKPIPNKDANTKPLIKPIPPTITVHQPPLTSYRLSPTTEDIQKRKWQCLTKFQHLSSKAHYIHSLKNATLFLAYSLAEKTVSLVLNESLTFEYWAVCCMFMSMKYEEIYPPRLRDMQGIIKAAIDNKLYWEAEITVWEYIGQSMNFVSLNTRLSKYLHAITKKERFFIYYLLEIVLYKRIQFKNYTQKELLLSVVYIFTSQKLNLQPEDVLDDTSFEKIEFCAKKIIMSQIETQQSGNLIFKKYQMETRECVALKGIPHMESLRNLLVKMVNEPEQPPNIIGFCSPFFMESEMVDESQEIEGEVMRTSAADLYSNTLKY